MAAIQVTDIIDGSSFRASTQGYTDTRRFLVSGLTARPSGIRYQAYQAVASQAGVTMFSPHPDVPLAYCNDVQVTPFTKDAKTLCYVVATYSQGGGGPQYKIIISGSNQQIAYNIDKDGNPILIYYSDPSLAGSSGGTSGGNGPSTALPGTALPQRVALSALSPNTIIEYQWISTVAPLGLNLRYRRKLNASTWNGLPRGEVLCRGVNATSGFGLQSWNYSAMFEHSPDYGGFSTWNQLAYYHDPHTGQIPPDIDANNHDENGVQEFELYDYAEFNDLGLPIIG